MPAVDCLSMALSCIDVSLYAFTLAFYWSRQSGITFVFAGFTHSRVYIDAVFNSRELSLAWACQKTGHVHLFSTSDMLKFEENGTPFVLLLYL